MRINGTTNHSSWTFKLEVSEGKENIEKNTSPVTVTAYIGRGSSGSYMTRPEATCEVSVTGCKNKTISYLPNTTVNVAANDYVSIGSVTFDVPHDANGSKTVTISATLNNDVNPTYASASGSMKLVDIPRYCVMSTASNFNDEQNPKITFANPSKYFTLKAKIEAGGNSSLITRTLDKTATSCTFSLTEAERDKLRALCTTSNSLAVRFTICCMSGSTELSASYLDRTMTIVNGNPTFTTFTYKDTNSKVTNLLGSDQLLVKGLSNLQITILATNKMTTKKKATAKNYVVTVDNINKSINYSTSDIVQLIGTLKTSGTKRLTVRAYDSRNNSVAVNKDIFVYEYEKPIINATVNRLNNFENQTTLSVKGSFSKLVVDNVEKNAITSLQYRYREHNGTWNTWTDLEGTITDNKFECKDVILSLDNTKAFEFEVKVVDNLSENTSKLNVDIGQAIFMISSNQKKCFVNGNEVLGFELVDEWN